MNDLLKIIPSVQDKARTSTQVCDSNVSLFHSLEKGGGAGCCGVSFCTNLQGLEQREGLIRRWGSLPRMSLPRP